MEDKTLLICVAIICLTLIELCALALGFNGQVLNVVIAAIAGLVGYQIKEIKKVIKKTT